MGLEREPRSKLLKTWKVIARNLDIIISKGEPPRIYQDNLNCILDRRFCLPFKERFQKGRR
jgi:hypothetical protein